MSRGAFLVDRDPQNRRDILFEVAFDAPVPIPDEQLDLKAEIESSLSVLRVLFPGHDRRFEEYFVQLLSLAQVGLVGEAAQPDAARRALLSLQNEVVAREGGRVKNQYMKRLGLAAFCFFAVAALLYLANIVWVPAPRFIAYTLLLWAGCMIGVWLSFGIRRTAINFENLHILEEDRLEPVIRLLFTGFLTLFIGLLFWLEVVTVSVGEVSTAAAATNPYIALLIGIVCGINEKILSAKAAQQAASFLDF